MPRDLLGRLAKGKSGYAYTFRSFAIGEDIVPGFGGRRCYGHLERKLKTLNGLICVGERCHFACTRIDCVARLDGRKKKAVGARLDRKSVV